MLSDFIPYFFDKILNDNFISIISDLISNKLILEVYETFASKYLLEKLECNVEKKYLNRIYLYEKPEVIAFFHLIENDKISLDRAIKMCERLPKSKFVKVLQNLFYQFVVEKLIGEEEDEVE